METLFAGQAFDLYQSNIHTNNSVRLYFTELTLCN